jgi:myo-inositol-1(or 4)-monophosphatase
MSMLGATQGWRPETIKAVEVVSSAVELARNGVGADRVTSKGTRDVVTATDVAVEDRIRTSLLDGTDVPVIGEERGGEPPADGSPYWLVDPICGTRNFASGTPMWCVNITLVEEGRVTVGVVGDPSGEIAIAELGGGAWAQSGGVRRRLTTTGASETVIVELGRPNPARRERAAAFGANAVRADRWEIRAFGTSLSLPYVAAGRFAAYVLFSISALHAAAGALLVAEAGGVVSDLDGHPWTVRSDSLVASAAPDIHEAILELIPAGE